jgi:chromosome segregation ATPase
MVEHRDFVEFYISTHLKEELKAELIEEMGLSIEQAKERLLEQIKEESERHRRLYIAQVEEFDRQLKSLSEEVEFLRELVVDANYQRNSNDDLVARLQEQVRDLEERLMDLQALVDEDREEAPPMPQGGQEL